MNSFKKMFVANFKELIRDGGTIFLAIFFPLILAIIFGIIFNEPTIEDHSFNIGIVDTKNEITDMISEQFKDFKIYVGSEAEEILALEKGERDVVLKFPNVNFEDLADGDNYNVVVFLDYTKSDANHSLVGYLRHSFVEIEDLITNNDRKINVVLEGLREEENINTFQFIFPGILALTLMQMGLFGALEYLKLRENKVFRSLSVTPLSKSALIGSDLLIRVILSFVQATVLISAGYLLFGLTIKGSLIQFVLLLILGCLTFTSIGFLLISFVKNSLVGNALVQIIQMVMMFLSGIFFPIDSLPSYLRPVTRALPLTYLGDAFRQVILGTTGEFSMLVNVSVLIFSLILTSTLTIKLWKWE